MSTLSVRWSLVAGICAVTLVPANADVLLILRDGRVINVPIAPEEVQSIELKTGRTGASPWLPPAPTMNNVPPAPGFKPGSKAAPEESPPVAPPKSGATFTVPPP